MADFLCSFHVAKIEKIPYVPVNNMQKFTNEYGNMIFIH